MGSSPLTRGKPGRGPIGIVRGGLIPAHAGKTFAFVLPTCQARAHPRSRGENSAVQFVPSVPMGSSPLTRGKPLAYKRKHAFCGLIPAHAGKTLIDSTSASSARAHPRSRGENTTHNQGAITRAGSSPLTRGKPSTVAHDTNNRGLIPAHAGKTLGGYSPPFGCKAHPRSRGENSRIGIEPNHRAGSSPLTRGKPIHSSV